MTLDEYWEQLRLALAAFKPFKTTPEDESNFQTQKRLLEAMLEKGLQIQKLGKSQAAIPLGVELADMPGKVYDMSENVPLISGPLSLAFAEQVYLPHLERFREVEFSWATQQLAKLGPEKIQPNTGKLIAEKNAAVLRSRIGIPLPVLKLQLQSIDTLSLIAGDVQTNKSKKSLKDILDFDNQYNSLAECLEKSNLTKPIKNFLLENEKKNTPVKRWLRLYRPVEILQKCNLSVLKDEKARIQKEIDKPSYNSLRACLDALLKKRKKDFYQSDKCREIAALARRAENQMGTTENLIVELKNIVSPHRDEKKWYVRTRNVTPTSLGIFNKFFTAENEPISVSSNNVRKTW